MNTISITLFILLLLQSNAYEIHVDPLDIIRETKNTHVFASYSLELPAERCLIGPSGNPRTSYARLLNHLARAANTEEIIIRLGGNSADKNCFEDTDKVIPGCKSNITVETLKEYQRFAAHVHRKQNLRVSFVLGTNLGGLGKSTNGSRIEAREIEAANTLGMLGDVVRYVEIGNEVDSYISTYPHAGMDTPIGFSKSFAEYVEAYERAGLGPHMIQGGAFADVFRPDFDLYVLLSFLATFQDSLGTLSIHNYARVGCAVLPWQTKKPTVTTSELLSRFSSKTQAELYRPFGHAARSRNISFVIGESNSVSCGGQTGVSDTFAAALWGIDYLAEMQQTAGADLVNFHGSRSSYSAIFCNSSADRLVHVRPLYYAQLFHSEFAPVGSSYVRSVRARDFFDRIPQMLRRLLRISLPCIVECYEILEHRHG